MGVLQNLTSLLLPRPRPIQPNRNLTEVLRQLAKQRSQVTLADLKRKVGYPKIDATVDELLQTYGVGVWVYAAVNIIAEKSASVAWQIVDRDNNVVEGIKHPLVSDSPNPMMPWTVLRQLTQEWLDLTGIAFWLTIDDEYWGLRPSRIKIVPGADCRSISGYLYKPDSGVNNLTSLSPIAARRAVDTAGSNTTWGAKSPFELAEAESFESFNERIQKWSGWLQSGIIPKATFPGLSGSDGGWIPIPAENVIRIYYPHPNNDFYGMSPIQPLLLSFTTELMARGWNKRFFENGAIPEGIVTFPEFISEEEFDLMQDYFEKEHGGFRNAWKPLMLQGGAAYTPFTAQHRDLEFLNLLKMSREDTLAALGVPPVMVGIYEFSNTSGRSAGAENQEQGFWNNTVIPKLDMWAEWLNHSIDFGDGLKLAFDYTSIDALTPDLAPIAAGAKDALAGGGLTVAEVRKKFWKVAGEFEGAILIPANLIPVTAEDLANGTMPQPPKETSPEAVFLKEEGNAVLLKEEGKKEIPSDDWEIHEAYGDKAMPILTGREKARTQKWLSVIKQEAKLEDELFAWLKRMFREQQARFVDAVSEKFDSKALRDITDVPTQHTLEEQRIWVEEALKEFAILLEESARFGLSEAKIDPDLFDTLNPAVRAFVQDKALKFSNEINETTLNLLRAELQASVESGETIAEITKRIRKVFQGTVRGSAPRARMIARTEMTGIFNGGHVQAYAQHPDLVEKVEWLSSRDNRVRPTHTAADGQVVAVGNFFSVGGAQLRFPGDPGGPPQEIIQCRCTVLPVLSDEE